MKKLLILLSFGFLIGCTSLDTSMTTLNNYYVEMNLSNSEIDLTVPKFRPDYIYFSQYSPEVSKTFNSELLVFANNFKRYSNPQNAILITGYIDSTEKEREFNDLGKKRGNEVKNILIKMGIPDTCLIVRDLGGQQYLSDNKTIRNKAKNRAVSIKVLKKN